MTQRGGDKSAWTDTPEDKERKRMGGEEVRQSTPVQCTEQILFFTGGDRGRHHRHCCQDERREDGESIPGTQTEAGSGYADGYAREET